MYMKVLPVGEARRRLPELVRRVAGGHPPVAIGRRGRPEAVLAAAAAPTPVERRPLAGMVRIVGGWSEVESAQAEIRGSIEESLQRTARLIGGAPRRRPRSRS